MKGLSEATDCAQSIEPERKMNIWGSTDLKNPQKVKDLGELTARAGQLTEKSVTLYALCPQLTSAMEMI